jgi:hypothetical protein
MYEYGIEKIKNKRVEPSKVPFCVRRLWWLFALALIAIVIGGVLLSNQWDKKTTEDSSKIKDAPKTSNLLLKTPSDPQPTAPSTNVIPAPPADTNSTQNSDSQAIVPKGHTRSLNDLQESEISNMPPQLQKVYRQYSSLVGKENKDDYGNTYTVTGIYLRDVVEYT